VTAQAQREVRLSENVSQIIHPRHPRLFSLSTYPPWGKWKWY